MMKKLIPGIFILVYLMGSSALKAQSEWQIKAFGGISDASFLGGYLIGGPGLNVDQFQEYGLRVGWKGNRKWGIESGLTYSRATLEYSFMPMPGANQMTVMPIREPFDFISVPLLGTFELASFLSINAGPLFGIQLSESSDWFRQSGFGYLIGLNFQHYFNQFGVFVQPNFKQHAVVSFNQSGVRLTEFGLQVGVAYRFLRVHL